MNTPETAPFLTAIESGDTAACLRLLELGADVDACFNQWRESPLHKAVAAGQTAIVRLLLEHGAYVNVENELWKTPLHYAASRERPDIVSLLLDHGAYVSGYAPGEPFSDSPLHDAARCGRVPNMEILLAHGADIDAPDDEDDTPLAVAAYEGEEEAVAFLLARGANARRINRYDETPLERALITQQHGSLRLLIEHGALSCCCEETAWFQLAKEALYGSEQEFAERIQAGTNINSTNILGSTVLHLAAEMGYADACRRLLAGGAATGLRDAYGRTALDYADARRHTGIAAMLTSAERHTS